MTKMPWLLIDGGWLAYRAMWSVMKDQCMHQADLAAFLILDQLRVICCDPKCQSNRVGVFFDSRTSRRRASFPAYKASRKTTDPDKLEQLKCLWEGIEWAIGETFPALGVPVYRKEGYEADDLIAAACEVVERAIIITADGDLYQMISEKVHWYDPSRRRYYTPTSFELEKGITPYQWVRVKSIAGCSGDGIPGVGGVGEKTAILYLIKTLTNGKRLDAIEGIRGQEIIARNLKLVRLPYEGAGVIKVREPGWDLEGFAAECRQRDLESFVDGERLRDWRMIVAGKFSATDAQRGRQRRRVST